MSSDLPKLECAACAEDGPCPLHDSGKIALAQDPGPSLEIIYAGPPKPKNCEHCHETDMKVLAVEQVLRQLSEKMYESSSLKESARTIISLMVSGIPGAAAKSKLLPPHANFQLNPPFNQLSKEIMAEGFAALDASPKKLKIPGSKQCPVCKGAGKTTKKYTCPMCMGSGRTDG